MFRIASTFSFALVLLAVGCDDNDRTGTDAGPTPTDAGPSVDASADAGIDASADAGIDASADAGIDASTDAGIDASTDAAPYDGGPPMTTVFPERDFVCGTGASPPCPTTTPRSTEAERSIDIAPEMPPTTYTYVVSTWSMPENSSATAAGFNLDMFDSGEGSLDPFASCEEFAADYHSVRDPGHVGVDNAMGDLVSVSEGFLDPSMCPGGVTQGCLDAEIASQIADGTFLLLVELTGVESLTYDPAVEVALYLGAVPGGADPLLGGDGRLAPGQHFDTVATLAAPVPGDIFAGRLRVRFPGSVDLPLRVEVFGTSRLDTPEFRATIDPSGLTLGVAGATTEVDYIVTQSEMAMPGSADTVRAVLESVADISPSAADPELCDSISSGYLWDAVPASRM